MPFSAAGRRARCRSCGAIFTVPARECGPASEPIPPAPGSKHTRAEADDEPYAWLEEFSKVESKAAPQPAARPIDLVGEVGEPAEMAGALPAGDEPGEHPSADEGRDWITGPRQSFWRDLAESFLFFMTPGNLITFIIIAVINACSVPLSYLGILGLIASFLILGYLCAFYMSIILETASGEDELPNVWISSIFDDIVMPMVRFVGTWVWVLLPALGLALWSQAAGREVPWGLVQALVVIGLFFWPVVILGVAIGGGFKGLWPHVIIRTAFCALLPYLAICATLLVAASLLVLPQTDLFLSAASRFVPGAMFQLAILNSVLNAYVMIVAMRIIGLFYRHYKHRFPWKAE